MGIVANGSLGFTLDLNTFSFVTAPAVNDFDLLFINSDTTIATPTGFTLLDSSVVQQGSYVFYRKAIGGEGTSVDIDPTGIHETAVCWARVRSAIALDKNAKAVVASTQAATGPVATTTALAETGELSFAWSALHRFATNPPSAPSWNNGYTLLESVVEGTGLTGTAGILGYKTNVGTAAETASASWTDNVYDRDTYIVTLTLEAATGVTLDVKGELNRIAKTSGLEEMGAANVIAGTNGLETVGALNTFVGNAFPVWRDLQGVANQIAGTDGLGTAKALSLVPPIP